MMRLREIPPERYARDVLPFTAALWAGRRSLSEYVAQTLEIARSPFGRRHYCTIGLYDGALCAATFKRYDREIACGPRRLRALGFGAVFTPEPNRGRGYGSVMVAMALDAARRDGYDLGFLFSDIRPQFYAELGFRELPSRRFSLRAGLLPAARIGPARLRERDWNGVRRLFGERARRRAPGFLRDASTWGWIALRMRKASERANGHETNLVVRRRGGVAAYVFGARNPARDAFELDELGCMPESAELGAALLRSAAGDLRRITGWLPPDGYRELLPAPSVRKRGRAILMMAPLSSEGEELIGSFASRPRADFCWPNDHV
jgi:GNAT superfamily N-acetyltransferase